MGSYYQYKRMAPYYTDQNYSYPEKMEVFCPLAVLAGLTVLLLDDEEEEE